MNYINPHSDEGFVGGLKRYWIAKDIAESDSCDIFKKKLHSFLNGKDEEEIAWLDLLWKENRFSNLCILIDYALSEYCGYSFSNNLLKDTENAKNYVIEKIKRKNRLNTLEDAAKKLTEEVKSREDAIFSPHILMLTAGFGLGIFKNFLEGHLKDFNGKENFINKLSQFTELRDLVTHNRCSSRIELEKVIDDAITVGKNILKIIANLQKEEFNLE